MQTFIEWLKKVVNELTVETAVELFKSVKGTAVEKTAGGFIRNIGGADLADEQHYAVGLGEAFRPDDDKTPAFSHVEYEYHLARVVKDVHPEKFDTYRLQQLAPLVSGNPNTKDTSKIITSHVKMTDKEWKNHVIFHNLDKPFFPVSIENEIKYLQEKIKDEDNTPINFWDYANPKNWFSL
jgi:hypothetical protein